MVRWVVCGTITAGIFCDFHKCCCSVCTFETVASKFCEPRGSWGVHGLCCPAARESVCSCSLHLSGVWPSLFIPDWHYFLSQTHSSAGKTGQIKFVGIVFLHSKLKGTVWLSHKVPGEVLVFGGYLKYILPLGILGMVVFDDVWKKERWTTDALLSSSSRIFSLNFFFFFFFN